MTSSRHRRILPSLETLEIRIALSTMAPANVLGNAFGEVDHPHEVSTTRVVAQAKNLTPQKRATILGLFVEPTPGSSLAPRILGVTGLQGTSLAVKQGRQFRAGVHAQTVAFTKIQQPGSLSTGVTGRAQTVGGYLAQTTLVGDVNGDGVVNLADVQAFAASYMSRKGEPSYNPAADFNQNGVVNLEDAKALMKNVAPLVPRRPLEVTLQLAPQDRLHYKGPQNSGGVTFKRNVTIIGRTTPGSLVIEDNQTSRLPGGTQAYKFTGPAHAADAQGFFSIPAINKEGLNNNDFLILDPFGQSLIRDYPIFWVPYATGHGVPRLPTLIPK
jgi:hypothetical protein